MVSTLVSAVVSTLVSTYLYTYDLTILSLSSIQGGPTMRHRLTELNSRCENPQILRLVYILLVLLAMAVAGGAPIAPPVGG